MTRDEVLAIIASGGSVLHNGRLLVRPDEVPTDQQLAVQTDQLQYRIDYLETMIRELTAERAALLAQRVSPLAKKKATASDT